MHRPAAEPAPSNNVCRSSSRPECQARVERSRWDVLLHIRAAIQFQFFGTPISCPRTGARASATPVGRLLPLPAPAKPSSTPYSYPVPAAPPHSNSSPPPAASEAFALLTNAHLVSFGKDNTIRVLFLLHLHTLHTRRDVPSVAALIRLRAHAHAHVHLDALTADAVWDAAHAEVKHEEEEAESRQRIVSLLPLLRLVCIGAANNDAVPDPDVAPAARFR
ncbi:hypothetical protein B0H14DRAFT_3485720 [Mycena olivaceomarginata]|nr:hypothetical protein B0H14DRAFT_3485720 [Mycena olivaceomarginata]